MLKFTDEDEKFFWKEIYLNAVRRGSDCWNACALADMALTHLRERALL